MAASAEAHDRHQTQVSELTSRLKQARRRAGVLERDLESERRDNRRMALHCRQADMNMARLKVGGDIGARYGAWAWLCR